MTESQRKAMERYLASPKGKAARRRAQQRYETTARAKIRASEYRKSCKGQEAQAKYRRSAAILKRHI